MARNSYSIGVLLIGVAIVLLLGKLGVFHFVFAYLWPLALLIPGLLFHALYFNRMLPAGVLLPGGILTTYSLMFFYCNMFGWGSMSYLWPGFIFGVAVGLYELHLFDRSSDRGIMTAALILGVASAVFFVLALLFKLGIYVVALLLIIGGVLIMMRKPRIW